MCVSSNCETYLYNYDFQKNIKIELPILNYTIMTNDNLIIYGGKRKIWLCNFFPGYSAEKCYRFPNIIIENNFIIDLKNVNICLN